VYKVFRHGILHGGWRRTREVKTESRKKVKRGIGASCIKLYPLFGRGRRHHTSLEKKKCGAWVDKKFRVI